MEQQSTSGGILANPILAFIIGLGGFGVLFVALDFAIMRAQGLTLLFHG